MNFLIPGPVLALTGLLAVFGVFDGNDSDNDPPAPDENPHGGSGDDILRATIADDIKANTATGDEPAISFLNNIPGVLAVPQVPISGYEASGSGTFTGFDRPTILFDRPLEGTIHRSFEDVFVETGP